jgi:hypothetical protein
MIELRFTIKRHRIIDFLNLITRTLLSITRKRMERPKRRFQLVSFQEKWF